MGQLRPPISCQKFSDQCTEECESSRYLFRRGSKEQTWQRPYSNWLWWSNSFQSADRVCAVRCIRLAVFASHVHVTYCHMVQATVVGFTYLVRTLRCCNAMKYAGCHWEGYPFFSPGSYLFSDSPNIGLSRTPPSLSNSRALKHK